jgi:nitrogen-specific signal transduction histidine kinase
VTQKFSGKIEVESKPGDTRFIVRLPLTPPK